jgi:hypothetical protein
VFNTYLALLVTLALSAILGLLIAHDHLYAQVYQIGGNTTPAPNNNMTAGASSNSTGIMKNTTGMIDDAFDALKDTFGSFFGK